MRHVPSLQCAEVQAIRRSYAYAEVATARRLDTHARHGNGREVSACAEVPSVPLGAIHARSSGHAV